MYTCTDKLVNSRGNPELFYIEMVGNPFIYKVFTYKELRDYMQLSLININNLTLNQFGNIVEL